MAKIKFCGCMFGGHPVQVINAIVGGELVAHHRDCPDKKVLTNKKKRGKVRK